ncbi:MAG: outer membrane protein assembly factor BamD [Pirellulales bacterium]
MLDFIHSRPRFRSHGRRASMEFVARAFAPPLVLLIVASAGCAPWSKGLFRSSPGDAVKGTPTDRERVSNIEQRYREEYDPIKPVKADGLDALKPEVIKAQFLDATGNGPNAKAAKELFAEAERIYALAIETEGDRRTELFSVAAANYTAAAEKWPDSLLEEDARFLAGESYFFADMYPKANEQYEILVKKHPNTRHMDLIDARRFSIAQYWLELDHQAPQSFMSMNLTNNRVPWRDTRGHAFRVFDRIRIDDPTGKLSDDATLAAANGYFARGDYFKADQLYTDLRKTFPSSEHQFLAHFLGLKAKLQCYEGPDYSGEMLDQAEQLIKQMRRQFPQQAEQEKEFLSRAYAEVRFKKAERGWTLGRYHELRAEYRAAEFYYSQVVKDYSDTPFADDAKQRIEANSELPPVPPQRFEWLVNMFPQRQNAKPLLTSGPLDLGLPSVRR